MENQNNNIQQSMTGWNEDDKRKIANAVKPLLELQKSYGRKFDLQIVLRGWQMLMEKRFNAEQVCYAIYKYMEQKSDFPAPADLIKILSPPENRITTQEYWHAVDQWTKECYPQFSYYAQVVKDYKRQQANADNMTVDSYMLTSNIDKDNKITQSMQTKK